jgi:hypothetical protein
MIDFDKLEVGDVIRYDDGNSDLIMVREVIKKSKIKKTSANTGWQITFKMIYSNSRFPEERTGESEIITPSGPWIYWSVCEISIIKRVLKKYGKGH